MINLESNRIVKGKKGFSDGGTDTIRLIVIFQEDGVDLLW